MANNFDVCVFQGSIYNAKTRMYEVTKFIYIGFTVHIARQNVILTDIETDNPKIKIVRRTDITEHIMRGSVYTISVQDKLNIMKKVTIVPPIAESIWNNVYNSCLKQWVETMYLIHNYKKIQKAWINAFYNPSYAICKKRLLNELNSLNNV
jgi:hypothetical protein